MKAGIYYNKKYFSADSPVIERICAKLKNSGAECKIVNESNDLNDIEVLFVFGGDGTILSIAPKCAEKDIKILGINYGHLGFLAEFEPERAEEAVEMVANGKYNCVERNMLKVECGDKVFTALNDTVVQRNTSGNSFSNTIALRAEIDGSVVDNYLADGIIVSTPTGSTAYSLSAGGSILTPDINAFVMTPICAHSLHSRPVVYNDKSVLEIYPLSKDTLLNLIIDGKVVKIIKNELKITITKSDYSVKFITNEEKDFFKKLSIKLNIWSK